MTRSILTLCCAMALLVGCASQPEVVRIGGNRYRATAAQGGAADAEEAALTLAIETCRSLGQTLAVTDIRTGWAFPPAGVSAVRFLCLP